MTDSATPAVQQWTAKQDRDNLRLIPPLAEEFEVYGGKGTVERARRWALSRAAKFDGESVEVTPSRRRPLRFGGRRRPARLRSPGQRGRPGRRPVGV